LRAARILAAGALAAVLLAGAGCRGSLKTRTVSIRADSTANSDTPIPVDLVVIYDKALAAQAAELTARQWFTRKAQIARDHPRGVRSVSWELVPGQRVPVHRFPFRRKGARAAFVFADYLAPGDHRVRIDPLRAADVVLGAEEVTVAAPMRR
jgi:type VI secretion system protein